MGEAPGENAKRYNSLFMDVGLAGKRIETPELPAKGHVFTQYVIRAQRRDALREFLQECGVQTAVYYPLSLHLQPCFRYLGYREGDFPESEKASREVLALPVQPDLKVKEQNYVIQSLQKFYG